MTYRNVIVLETLSQILPDHTYLAELRIDGNKLRLTGITRDAPSLIGLIEQSAHFKRATFFAPTTRASSDSGERFPHRKPRFNHRISAHMTRPISLSVISRAIQAPQRSFMLRSSSVFADDPRRSGRAWATLSRSQCVGRNPGPTGSAPAAGITGTWWERKLSTLLAHRFWKVEP